MKKIILSIDGMTCSACSNGLEKYLNKQEGIHKAVVNLVLATASIEYDDNLNINDLDKLIKNAGFKSLGIADIGNKKRKPSIIPFIVYGILAIILMYISMSRLLSIRNYPISYSIISLLLTIPFLIYGFDIIKSGIKNLIHKMPNMDTLVGIGVISSFLYSMFGVVMVIIGHNEYINNLYFESVVFVIYFIKLGRFIDRKAHDKLESAISKLVTITPSVAYIKSNNGIKEITIDEVKKNDILVCPVGEKIAVDGVIISGKTHLDESFITGESKPISKSINDQVVAGSINYDGVIEYKALKIGKETMVSSIINLVVEATNTKAPISLLADRICSYFVPIVIVLSLLVFIINLALGGTIESSLIKFVTVLVVACPCSLGLATPLAVIVSEGVSAKEGILVKSSETLELVPKINTIVFDKTGTLTNGNLTISKFYNYSNLEDNEILRILGSIEKSSTHPIAKGIINYISDKKISLNDFKIKDIPGLGIKATFDKKIYYAGNHKLLDELKLKNNYKEVEEQLSKEGNSIVYIVEDNKILGLVGVKDTIRKEANKMVNRLKKLNFDVIMLTGDNEKTAKCIAKELGIDNVIADVLPTDKASVIKNINGKVIMVGDGINDALSLTVADIGISLSSSTDIARDAADVILTNNNLMKILRLFEISKKTLRIIKQNLFWAFIYNICMIPLACFLVITPSIACLSMICSSLIVTFNSLRLK